MTIMVAGGLTFAIPGMEPAQAAQISSNPNLKVSAEGQNAGNEIAHTNIVQVVILDELTDVAGTQPLVTVNDEDLTMGFRGSAWYGYFVSDDFPFGTVSLENHIRNAPTTEPALTVDAVMRIDADAGEFDVVYQRPGGDQTVTLDLDNPASGVSLDRNSYPQNTAVEITLDDMALNVDPTDDDVWRFDENGAATYLGNGAADFTADADAAADDDIEDLSITTHNQRGDSLLVDDGSNKTTDDSITFVMRDTGVDDPDNQGTNIFERTDAIATITFTEDGNNETQFINDELSTTAAAARGLSFSVTYDSTSTSSIGFSTARVVIDAGDEWSSGEEIGITLTDADANTNTGNADDLDISNPDHMIPTITIGTPQTLTTNIKATLTSDDLVGVSNTSSDEVRDVAVSQRALITVDDDATRVGTLTIDLTGMTAADYPDTTFQVVNYDFSAFEDATIAVNYFRAAVIDDPDTDDVNEEADEINTSISTSHADRYIVTEDKMMPNRITLTFAEDDALETSAVTFDVFTFGLEADLETNVNDAIYRLELDEDGDDSSDFTGTLEYIGLSQINILDEATYGNIDVSGDSIILISDDGSVSVEYLDLDSTGGTTLFTAEADTPTHSGVVSLGSDGYRVADTVVVTVEDADLNVDSGKADVYTVVSGMIETEPAVAADTDADPPVEAKAAVMETQNLNDRVGSDLLLVHTLNDDDEFGALLSVSFDGELWTNHGCAESDFSDATSNYGLADTQFTLQETGAATGVFVGTFAAPAEHCTDADDVESITGKDISVEYIDFRDDSGSTISVSASAGIRSNTGSVSLDRTVYPVPFGTMGSTAENNSVFETHTDGVVIDDGSLTVYVSINDADFDQSANGIDRIETDDDTSLLSVSVIRGSQTYPLETAGQDGTPIL